MLFTLVLDSQVRFGVVPGGVTLRYRLRTSRPSSPIGIITATRLTGGQSLEAEELHCRTGYDRWPR